MKNRIHTSIIFTLLSALSSCGGSGNDNSSSIADNSAIEKEVIVCSFNQVLVGEECRCPDHLVNKDGYCIDWAESVPQGAEFLRPGFPVAVTLTSGTTISPYYVKAANIDKDPELEIVYQPPNSPTWAWNIDGTLLEGWPVSASTFLQGRIVFAQLDDDIELELFSGHRNGPFNNTSCEINVFEFDGSIKTGWPITTCNQFSSIPAAADFNNDGYDEVIYLESDPKLIDRNGVIQTINIHNTPVFFSGFCCVSIADIDGNGSDEILLLSNPYSDPIGVSKLRSLYVLDKNFEIKSGFPIEFRSGPNNQPVIGDVDGDGDKEIIVLGSGTLAQAQNFGILSVIKIISHLGVVENEINFTYWISDSSNHPIVLADLNQNGNPEILVFDTQDGNPDVPPSAGIIHALDASGTELPGWPVVGGRYFAVGDIDEDPGVELVAFGDGLQDDYSNRNQSKLLVYSSDGKLKNIEVTIDFMGEDPRDLRQVMPVIEDFDLDGRNELIVIGNYWDGQSGIFPQVWAFNFNGYNHGPIEWGQMFGDAKNSGEYSRP